MNHSIFNWVIFFWRRRSRRQKKIIKSLNLNSTQNNENENQHSEEHKNPQS